MFGNLLLDEPPLQVMPTLATLIGLNESIVLQQLHYWLNKSKHEHEGRYWVYNSYEDWQAQFPFWSAVTIKRTVLKLEKMGLVISANFNKLAIDKTKWYSIDYEVYERMIRPSDQFDTSNGSIRYDQRISVTRALPETTTENTSEITAYQNSVPQDIEFERFWTNYPRKLKKQAARKCFDKTIKESGLEPKQLTLAAENYALYCQNKRRPVDKILHATTFLGPQKPYEDYLYGVPEMEQENRNLQLLREMFEQGPEGGDLLDL